MTRSTAPMASTDVSESCDVTRTRRQIDALRSPVSARCVSERPARLPMRHAGMHVMTIVDTSVATIANATTGASSTETADAATVTGATAWIADSVQNARAT